MSAPAVLAGRPTVRIRGTEYPVLLPTVRDPRLAPRRGDRVVPGLRPDGFRFELSIAHIFLSLLTCALLDFDRLLAAPADHVARERAAHRKRPALLLRVNGTHHGDWWCMRGWWIFAANDAPAILSKHPDPFRGRQSSTPRTSDSSSASSSSARSVDPPTSVGADVVPGSRSRSRSSSSAGS